MSRGKENGEEGTYGWPSDNERSDACSSMPSTRSSQRPSVLGLELDDGCTPSALLSHRLCSATSGMTYSMDKESAIGGGVGMQRTSGGIALHEYQNVPEFLKGNPYVKSGYRVFLPSSACFQSMFVWSNETVNIWTHLLGFAFFFFVMIYDNVVILYGSSAGMVDHLWITVGLLCYQFCMLCSAGFHLFNCHSEKASRSWFALDLAGISIGLIGCYLPGVHLAFYCHYTWRDVYLINVFLLAGVTLFCQFHPRFLSPSWATVRLLLYSSLAAFGLIPTVHWIYLNGGLEGEVVQMFLPKLIVMYSLALIALMFYLTKAPERCFPGRVDYVGSSHQWWHIMVVICFYWWHLSGQAILHFRLSHPCDI